MGERPMNEPFNGMFSGRCRGGPLNTKNLHHPETAYRVAVDADNPLRMYVGQVAPSRFAPNIKFGIYFYNHAAGEWVWNDHGRIVSSQQPETAETVHNPETQKEP
jgi:hypothetical protein